jgi:hypothetical protein
MVLALVLLPALAGPLGGEPRDLAAPARGDSLALTPALTLGSVRRSAVTRTPRR